MSRFRNRDAIEMWVWEWRSDMASWTKVRCHLPFDAHECLAEIEPMHEWLANDGYTGDYFIRPEGLFRETICRIDVLFQNPDAAFPFKMRWG